MIERLSRSHRRRADRNRGQSFVELALVLPVFLLIVLVGLDFGRAFSGWVTIQQSARAGANYLSINADKYGTTQWNPTLATMRSLVRRDAATANCDITDISYDLPGDGSGDPVNSIGFPTKVVVDCDFTIATPIISAILPNPLPLTAHAVFPIRTGAVENISGVAPAVPVASFSCSPTSGTAALTIYCTDTTPAEYAATAWSWDFGDGGTSTAQFPDHTYTTACLGPSYTCTVTFTATNVSGTSAPVTQTITVQPAVTGPVASFTCNPCSGAANLIVQFTDASTGTLPLTWAWDLNGDGLTDSTIQNPTHTYTAAATVVVTLTVTNAAGSNSATHNITVTNGFCQVPSFTAQGGDTVSQATVSTIQGKWAARGFTTTVLFSPLVQSTSNGRVKSQSLAANSTQLCNSTITLTWS